MRISIKILGTKGCHLCDEAKRVVEQVEAVVSSQGYTLAVTDIDIADDADLFSRYGEKIPVLRLSEQTALMHAIATDKELNWPFDAHGLFNYLTVQLNSSKLQ